MYPQRFRIRSWKNFPAEFRNVIYARCYPDHRMICQIREQNRVARAYSITGPLYIGSAREKKVRAKRKAALFGPETRRHLFSSKHVDEKTVELYNE